jgi:release factor glutamine methyltransferase
MPSEVKRVYFGDYLFIVDENVYEPSEDSFLFAENLKVKETEVVLDMGTGCGILSILVAKKSHAVVALDVNPYAVQCARENAKLNNVQNKIFCVQGDLFTSLSDNAKFDIIVFNAPYLPTEENETSSWIGRAWAGGAAGRRVIDRFIAEAPIHLRHTGRILLMQSTLANVNETLHRFATYHLKAQVVAERKCSFFETITLIEAKI